MLLLSLPNGTLLLIPRGSSALLRAGRHHPGHFSSMGAKDTALKQPASRQGVKTEPPSTSSCATAPPQVIKIFLS